MSGLGRHGVASGGVPAPPTVAVIGWGLCCGLGTDPVAVAAAIQAGASAIAPRDWLAPLSDGRAALSVPVALRPWLRRRKDGKLLARPAALVLPACGKALGEHAGDRLALGLWLGVGQEPAEDDASEAALVASARDGLLDEHLLATVGRDLYPPLLPLRTLPNMALAHVSINLGIGGCNGAWAGGPESSLHAIRAAVHAVCEGRAPAGLAGGTDSKVDLASARDLRRLGRIEAPGEAAAVLLLAPSHHPAARCMLTVVDVPQQCNSARARVSAHRASLGFCGAADGAVALLLAAVRVFAGGPAETLVAGHPGVALRVGPRSV